MGRRDKPVPTENIPPGAKLKQERQKKNISLTQMSIETGYSKSYLSTAENDTRVPSKDLVQAYERVLAFAPGELAALLQPEKPAFPVQQELSDLDRESQTRAEHRSQRIPFDEALLLEPARFVGREKDVAWLMERIKSGGVAGIAALRGLGGIGKTSLAAVVIRRLHQEGYFPDGIAVVLCQDLKEPAQVLHYVFSRFDPQYSESETNNFADLLEIAYQLLHGKKILVVLDNVQPELMVEQVVAPLRAAGASLLLTSRHVLPPGAVPTHAIRKLGLLSEEEALELFAHSLGKQDLTWLEKDERSAAERIVKALDYHTLAVKLSGFYAANLERDLEVLAETLENPQKAVELPEGEIPEAVKRVFEHSIDALPKETKILFAALAALATVEFSRNVTIALASGLQIPSPETHTNWLVMRSLVDAFVNNDMPRSISDRERLHLHPLLRGLALVQFEEWSNKMREQAFQAVAAYYTNYAIKVLKKFSNPDEIAVVIIPDVRNITASLEWAHEQHEDTKTMVLCSIMQHVWDNQWDTDASLRYLPWGIAAAETVSLATEHTTEQSTALHYLARLSLSYGNVLWLTSEKETDQRLKQAQSCYERSLTIARQLNNRQLEGVTLYRFGRLFRKTGDLNAAEQCYREALPLLQEIQNRRDEGWALAFLGQIKQDRGKLEEAEAFYQRVLKIYQEIQYSRGQGWIMGYLGRLALIRRQFEEAEIYCHSYLEIAENQHDRRSKAVCFSLLGEIALEKEKYNEAENFLTRARHILQEVHDTQSEGWVLKLLGELALKRGAYHQAKSLLKDALDKLSAFSDLRGKELIQTLLARIPQEPNELG